MAVLVAVAEQESLRLYAMDMLWMIVRSKYDGEFPQPSKLVKRGPVKKEKTASDIINDVVNKLT